MQPLRRIKYRLGFGTTPIRVGHQYRSVVTGERINVKSVGRKVLVEPTDADRRTDQRVLKSAFREAIDRDLIVHDREICPECRNDVQ